MDSGWLALLLLVAFIGASVYLLRFKRFPPPPDRPHAAGPPHVSWEVPHIGGGHGDCGSSGGCS